MKGKCPGSGVPGLVVGARGHGIGSSTQGVPLSGGDQISGGKVICGECGASLDLIGLHGPVVPVPEHERR